MRVSARLAPVFGGMILFLACDHNATSPAQATPPARPQFLVTSITPGYELLDLGVFGGTRATARAINNHGQIAISADEGRVVVWDDGAVQDVFSPPVLSPVNAIETLFINDAGHMAFTVQALSSECPECNVLVFASYSWGNGILTEILPPSFSGGAVSALSNAGHIVGVTPDERGFLWYAGTLTSLGAFVSPVAVNSHGDVAVNLGNGRAALWRDGAVTDLGTLGGSFTTASDLSGAGQVVGVSTTASGESHGFLWNGGVMLDLGKDFVPNRISDPGQIVGTSHACPSGIDCTIRYFTWVAGAPIDIGAAAPSTQSCSLNPVINNPGEVAAVRWPSGCGTSTSLGQPFVWANGVALELPTLASGPHLVHGFNDAGQVVGSGGMTFSDQHAVLWQPPSAAGVVQALLAQVDALALSGVLGQHDAQWLRGPLERAVFFLDRNLTAPANNNLEVFIRRVEKLVADGVLSPEQSAPLVATVRLLVESIGT